MKLRGTSFSSRFGAKNREVRGLVTIGHSYAVSRGHSRCGAILRYLHGLRALNPFNMRYIFTWWLMTGTFMGRLHTDERLGFISHDHLAAFLAEQTRSPTSPAVAPSCEGPSGR